MCTAITYKTKDFYFGRTLDYEISYGDEITITPRNYPFHFREIGPLKHHYAMIGMAYVQENYPLYHEAINEKGLCMAGLNFPGNAVYQKRLQADKDNVAQFELIPWLLGQCATVQEVRKHLAHINFIDLPFSSVLPPADLHWMIADREEAITLEVTAEGIRVYDNPVGVLTNNPPFNEQMLQLNNYMSLSAREPENHFCDKLPLHTYSRGMGALGLPGDLSSQSRFVRASFVKMNSVCRDSEEESVSQFFHILGSVEQQKGCCDLGDGKYEITLYTACCNADRGIYYYTSYGNRQISAVDMRKENLDAAELIRYQSIRGEQIRMQN